MLKIEKHTNDFVNDYTEKLYPYLSEKLKKAYNEKSYNILKSKKLKYTSEKQLLKVLKYIEDNLKDIISSTPTELKEFCKKIDLKAGNTYRKSRTEQPYKLHAILNRIFVLDGYEYKICKSSRKEIAYQIVDKLKLKSCPYCNRNYISTYKKDEENKKSTRPQLDHFISKSKYPFLACSIYNLIPSCTTCNLLKSDDDDDELINPFEFNSDSFNFNYKLNKDFSFGKISIEDIELNIQGIQSNKKIFLLEELYQGHKDIIIDILNKTHSHSQSFINKSFDFKTSDDKELISMEYIFESIYSEYLSKDEILKLLYNFELKKENFHKRPLSKLTLDILTSIKK